MAFEVSKNATDDLNSYKKVPKTEYKFYANSALVVKNCERVTLKRKESECFCSLFVNNKS